MTKLSDDVYIKIRKIALAGCNKKDKCKDCYLKNICTHFREDSAVIAAGLLNKNFSLVLQVHKKRFPDISPDRHLWKGEKK